MRVAPKSAVFVGDSRELDYVAARAVGMSAVWLDRSARAQAADTAVRISSLDELPKAFFRSRGITCCCSRPRVGAAGNKFEARHLALCFCTKGAVGFLFSRNLDHRIGSSFSPAPIHHAVRRIVQCGGWSEPRPTASPADWALRGKSSKRVLQDRRMVIQELSDSCALPALLVLAHFSSTLARRGITLSWDSGRA